MKEIFKNNKLISLIVISLQSNIGTIILITPMVLTDALGSAFAYSEIFVKRFEAMNNENAQLLALSSGAMFALVILIGIVITTVKPSMRGVSKFLTLVSAFSSFCGFIMFMIPQNFTFQNSFTLEFSVLLTLAFILAIVPAVVVERAAKDLTSDKAQNDMIKEFNREITAKIIKTLNESFNDIDTTTKKENKFIISKAA